jgi:DNA-binding CsgD family transcriptional regulator
MESNSPLSPLDQIFSCQKFEVDNADYLEFEKKVCFLERLSEVENSSVSVVDLFKKKYIFLGSRHLEPFENTLGEYEPQDAFYYIQMMHPEDLPIVMDSYKRTFKFWLSLPEVERKDYKLIINYRQRDKYGNYPNIIVQLVILELDKKGNIWLVLIIDDMLPDKITFEGVNRRLIHIKTGKICLFNNELETNKKTILSTREVEVLSLVSKGFASKEIADKLFLSVNTVNNHRQNILEKVGAVNTAEAATYARNLGLI